MDPQNDKFIPAAFLQGRLDKVRAKIESLEGQLADNRREEKILSSLLEEAEPSPRPESPTFKPSVKMARGVVDAIMGMISTQPGVSRNDLIHQLRHLNLNPFDQAAARRTILNNLGNLVRSGRVQEDPAGGLHPGSIPPSATPAPAADEPY